jgi:hypothetical protein
LERNVKGIFTMRDLKTAAKHALERAFEDRLSIIYADACYDERHSVNDPDDDLTEDDRIEKIKAQLRYAITAYNRMREIINDNDLEG